jgi:hypothetical protein
MGQRRGPVAGGTREPGALEGCRGKRTPARGSQTETGPGPDAAAGRPGRSDTSEARMLALGAEALSCVPITSASISAIFAKVPLMVARMRRTQRPAVAGCLDSHAKTR